MLLRKQFVTVAVYQITRQYLVVGIGVYFFNNAGAEREARGWGSRVGENIGDLSGLAVAIKAYKLSLAGAPAPVIDGYTGMQRFFLGWARIWTDVRRDSEALRLLTIDPHSPPQFRVNGPVSNLSEFYEAFGVKEGDGLYRPPAERVKIW